MNVLVTSLSRKVPLVETLRRALASTPDGGTLWGADVDPECVGRYFADRFWEMPALSEHDASERLLEFCRAEHIELVIPTRDGELPVFAALREQLSEGGTYAPIGSVEAVDVCLDKLRFHDHCASLGIPSIPTAAALGELGGERFVVKERRGAGSREVALGLERDAAAAASGRLEEPIFQPLVDGVEHSVDLYVNRRGQVVDAAPRTRIRVYDGESWITETVEQPALADAAIRFAESLELRGHLVIQGFAAGDEVTLLECNPRVGGASTLGFEAGVDTPGWALREAAGDIPEPQVGSYRRGVRLVRYPADRFER